MDQTRPVKSLFVIYASLPPVERRVVHFQNFHKTLLKTRWTIHLQVEREWYQYNQYHCQSSSTSTSTVSTGERVACWGGGFLSLWSRSSPLPAPAEFKPRVRTRRSNNLIPGRKLNWQRCGNIDLVTGGKKKHVGKGTNGDQGAEECVIILWSASETFPLMRWLGLCHPGCSSDKSLNWFRKALYNEVNWVTQNVFVCEEYKVCQTISWELLIISRKMETGDSFADTDNTNTSNRSNKYLWKLFLRKAVESGARSVSNGSALHIPSNLTLSFASLRIIPRIWEHWSPDVKRGTRWLLLSMEFQT